MNRRLKWSVVLFLAVVAVVVLILWSDARSGHSGPTRWRQPLGPGTPAVAIGDNHGVILAADGSLWTWGENGFGWQVLGLGSTVRTQACLRRIGADTNWVNVAVGGSVTLALKSDGTVWAWGENLSGQLGDGTKVKEQASPVRSIPGNDWKQVATSGIHSLALKRDGSLWAWGNNWAGQFGNGTRSNSLTPLRIGASTNWTRIWANLIETVGQQADGSLWYWGWDYTRSTKGSSIPVPTRISPDTNWVSVGMGDWMVFAIKSDGTLWAWGRLAHIYTGAAPDADSWPARVGTESDWRACASFAQSCPVFMKRDGSIWVMDASGDRGVASVTGIVSGLVTNNQLAFVADGSTLGGDPAFGVVKSLQVTCQIGSTSQVRTFRENSTVTLGAPDQPLRIISALFGDPKLLAGSSGRPLPAPNDPPAQLRRIQLPGNLAAFCGGRHKTGTALMADGEVWQWGEALGQHTRAVPPLQLAASLVGRLGLKVRWGDPGPVMLREPSRLGAEPP
ncbi:MAG TPA: hypothetical protein VMU04_12315 [Candidatus Acidoferrum sp.]|nr:hypothetical protein [Candidatus Acidoferrum sp.]